MKVNTMLLVFLLSGIGFSASAQVQELHWGFKIGTNSTWIRELQTTILSEPYFLNYTLVNRPVFPFQKFPDKFVENQSPDKKTYFPATLGGYVNYRFSDIVGFESGVYFSQQRSYLLFEDSSKDYNYKMGFDYSYINIPFIFNFYPAGHSDNGIQRFSIDVGVEAGLNVAPENISYKSWGKGVLPDFGTDLAQEQQLRNVLHGKSLFNLIGGFSYRFPGDAANGSRISLGLHYAISPSDAVETLSNSYNFIENHNTSSRVQLTVGFSFAKLDNNSYPKR